MTRAEDETWMAQALDLARGMRGRVWPNPPVGCVIVQGGKVVGRGATQPGGRPHAERVALDEAGAAAAGATLYVTLEPCAHWGKTPPCADAIIAAGVARVVASMQDPDPRVDGQGFAKLRAAGIEVEVGLGAREAYAAMEGFLHRVRTGRPLMLATTEEEGLPQGADALLRHEDGRPELLMPDGKRMMIFDDPADGPHLLDRLGGMGLTCVAMAEASATRMFDLRDGIRAS